MQVWSDKKDCKFILLSNSDKVISCLSLHPNIDWYMQAHAMQMNTKQPHTHRAVSVACVLKFKAITNLQLW